MSQIWKNEFGCYEHFDDKVAPIRTIFESGIGLIILCGSIHLKNFFSSFNAVENSYYKKVGIVKLGLSY